MAMRKPHRSGTAREARERLINARASPERRKMSSTQYSWWTMRKKYHDSAKAAMKGLSTDRAQEDDKWFAVGIALAAVDAAQGVGTDPECPIKSLRDVFVDWTKQHHGFEDVKLSKRNYEKFTLASREMMSRVPPEDDDGDDAHAEERWSVPSMKFAYPPPARKGQAPKPLSSDEKLRNRIVAQL